MPERTPEKLIHGLYAAVLAPRRADDSIDEPAFSSLIEFLLGKGVSGFAINGATGEFCLTTAPGLKSVFSVLRKTAPQASILCGVGAAGATKTIELAKIAADEGARALLLPMPFFFPYQQVDLEAFVHSVAGAVALPTLLYNLPDFTSPLDPETSCRLIREVPNVIGIKDSGQSLDTLRRLTAEKSPACRMVGNDGILVGALREGVCDGVVSGIAGVLPELTRAILDAAASGDAEKLDQVSSILDELKSELAPFPIPWGLKWLAEARGILTATFSQPVAAERSRQAQQLVAWFRKWQPGLARRGSALIAKQ